MPPWEGRFHVPVSFLPEWSPLAPERAVYASNESGVWQVHAWDIATGERRRVTDHAVGVTDGTPTLDGEGVVWFHDETGSEAGQWLVQPFAGGETRPFLHGVPDGWSGGLAQAPGIVAAALSNEDGFAIYVSLDGDEARDDPSLVGVGSHQQRRRGLSPRRSLGRRGSPLSRALRARRPHPSRSSRRRSSDGSDRGRADGRGHVTEHEVLVACSRRCAASVRSRA